ncbi:nuclear transport factor 2 family protein [Rhodococcus opacus]|uniref:nuclear transport factor 2 family protein n=1 Tax=Rhodococcus opacus TaxID=37919 RepID=UPI001C4476BE|nr:nuclear transport factor 2 family protein [Rhodococcus opacus]MBV6755018.1 nuclear transport factor 2 family protein [Rhodococcus opacus]
MAVQDEEKIEALTALMKAFNAHDLDAIMEFFTEDCSFDTSKGPEPWGQRLTGKAAVREGLGARFAGMPDVQYDADRHWVSGDLGVSEWLVTGTTTDGTQVSARGCDHWEFRDDKIVRKDSYWKIVDAPA